MPTRALGIRKPDTEIGSWEGAYVYCEDGEQKVCGVFMNGNDYVGYPQSFDDALWNYHHFRSFEWTPMTVEDISKTTGVDIKQVYRVKDLHKIRRSQPKRTLLKVVLAIGVASLAIRMFVDKRKSKR